MEVIKKGMKLSVPKNFNEGNRLPEIIIYFEENFNGFEYRTNCDVDFVGNFFNDCIKSIVVVSGTWEFFKDANFKKGKNNKSGFSFIYKIGYYLKLQFEEISSFRLVEL